MNFVSPPTYKNPSWPATTVFAISPLPNMILVQIFCPSELSFDKKLLVPFARWPSNTSLVV